MLSKCAWQSSCSLAQWKRGRTLGHDPCGGALRRTEAALSPGVTGGQAVVVDSLIISK